MARPRAEDYEEKRQDILTQAARLFARQGFARTSVSELSQACGASKAFIYHYYKSKEAILYDLAKGHVSHLVEVVGSVPECLPPAERFEALVVAMMDAYTSAADTHRCLVNELDSLPAAQRQEIEDLENTVVDTFKETVAAINPAVRGAPHMIAPAAMTLLGALNWHHTWFREGGPMDRPTYARMVARLFLDGLKALPPDFAAAAA